MAKTNGLGMQFYVAGYALGEDTREFAEIGGGPTALDFTPVTKSAMVRQGGQKDGRMNWTSFFNPEVGAAHEVLSALPTASRIATACVGTAIGSPAASIYGRQINYDPSRAQDGMLTAAVNIQGDGYGLEWGDLLTAATRTDTAATDGASVDFTAATDFGLQAYLHVLAFTGTDVTIKIQESSDDGGADAWADVTGGAFTAVTGTDPQVQRIQTARDLTVERYLRVVTATTGGFTDLQFLVAVTKNDTEVLL